MDIIDILRVLGLDKDNVSSLDLASLSDILEEIRYDAFNQGYNQAYDEM